MGLIKSLICRTLTIRGIGKIGSSQDRFIISIWMIFVFSMSFLLIYATAKVVQEFLNYDLVIRISIKSNDYSTLFPSFSFCHHHPFGAQSEQFWDNQTIMSPTEFNKKLRRQMKSFMESENRPPYDLFTKDERRVYYQHLSTSEADKLGWDTETFIICSIFTGSYMEITLGSQCSFKVKKISIPQFFNCFSVTPDDDDPDSRVTSMTLLIRVSGNDKTNPRNKDHHKSFIPGLLNQLSGLRGMIHERFTFPDIENEGFHLEPGKLVEINYAVIRKTKVSTPKRPCTSEIREEIFDLNQSFEFSQQPCFKSYKGRSSLKQCSCFYADTMRSGIPNDTHPYCGNILNIDFKSFIERVTCLGKWNKEFDKQIKQIFYNQCKPSCVHFNYDVSLSVTKWVPTNWQLAWLTYLANRNSQSSSTESSDSQNNDKPVNEELWREKFENYINSKDLFNYPKTGRYVDQDNFVMIVIKRRNFDTIEQREKLTLDLYNLISRFGGLCSLCLGLTCAFVMEIVEIIYLGINEHKKIIKNEMKKSSSEVQENETQILEKTSCESLVWLSSL